MFFRRKHWTLLALPLFLLVGLGLLRGDGGPNHQVKQTPPVQLGTSGGNVNEITRAFCCSGTLGSLVAIGSTNYILSNNHILARVGQATPGEDISQPGLIDVGCRASNANIVADFTSAPALGTANVDAAIAQVVSGQVDTSGAIIDVGVPSSTTAAPALSVQVAKSGRTTGLTCGSVTSTTTDVKVQYQKECNKGRKFFIVYNDQVVIGGSGFSAGGDSGSLIVTAAQARPVALLYAGSSSSTIGNPIGDVLNAFPGMSFVGGGDHAVSCPAAANAASAQGTPGRSAQGLERARSAKEQHSRALMMDPAVLGVGVGLGENGDPVIVIYVEEGREHGPLPQMLGGFRTQIVRTDLFRAYGWNEPETQPRGCPAR